MGVLLSVAIQGSSDPDPILSGTRSWLSAGPKHYNHWKDMGRHQEWASAKGILVAPLCPSPMAAGKLGTGPACLWGPILGCSHLRRKEGRIKSLLPQLLSKRWLAGLGVGQ